jgi:hypothetical protein
MLPGPEGSLQIHAPGPNGMVSPPSPPLPGNPLQYGSHGLDGTPPAPQVADAPIDWSLSSPPENELALTVMSPSHLPQLVPSQVVVPIEQTTDVPDLSSTLPQGASAPLLLQLQPGAGCSQVSAVGPGPVGVLPTLVPVSSEFPQPGMRRVPAMRSTATAVARASMSVNARGEESTIAYIPLLGVVTRASLIRRRSSQTDHLGGVESWCSAVDGPEASSTVQANRAAGGGRM